MIDCLRVSTSGLIHLQYGIFINLSSRCLLEVKLRSVAQQVDAGIFQAAFLQFKEAAQAAANAAQAASAAATASATSASSSSGGNAGGGASSRP